MSHAVQAGLGVAPEAPDHDPPSSRSSNVVPDIRAP